MTATTEKFLDIDQIEHQFPEVLEDIGFPVTLLHKHSHAPMDTMLVFDKGFKSAEYRSSIEMNQYYPCSWYLEGG